MAATLQWLTRLYHATTGTEIEEDNCYNGSNNRVSNFLEGRKLVRGWRLAAN
jgi:hypothetical protein